jgi:hypothetical protein
VLGPTQEDAFRKREGKGAQGDSNLGIEYDGSQLGTGKKRMSSRKEWFMSRMVMSTILGTVQALAGYVFQRQKGRL